jgi:hypothetical protein
VGENPPRVNPGLCFVGRFGPRIYEFWKCPNRRVLSFKIVNASLLRGNKSPQILLIFAPFSSGLYGGVLFAGSVTRRTTGLSPLCFLCYVLLKPLCFWCRSTDGRVGNQRTWIRLGESRETLNMWHPQSGNRAFALICYFGLTDAFCRVPSASGLMPQQKKILCD